MLTSTLLFLIKIAFELYGWVLVLRFLLQAVRAHYNNPLSVLTLQLTQPIVKPLQYVLPQWRSFDLAVLTLIFAIGLIKYILLFLLTGSSFALPGLLLISLADLLNQFCSCYFYLIIIRFILSWLSPAHPNPMTFIILQLTEPLLRPVRRVIPPLAGFDLSGLVVIIGLQLLQIVFIAQLNAVALTLL